MHKQLNGPLDQADESVERLDKSSLIKPFNKFKNIRDIPIRHLPVIQTGINLVWLGNSDCSAFKDGNNRLHTLSSRCFVVCYSSMSKCMKFLKRARSRDYVIVVTVSYTVEVLQKVLYRLQQYRVAQTILVVPSDVNSSDQLSSTSYRVSAFRDQNAMFDYLEQLIDKIINENIEGGLFTTFHRQEQALKDLRFELGDFLWTHVFRVILMNMFDDSIKAKNEMLSECRAFYRNDSVQLTRISEFERTYQSCDAIRWYTKPGFLYYLVNKALRTGDILALYKFRYFISNLSFQLKKISAARTWTMIHVYRGTKLSLDEIQRLKVGSIVAANSFFSCSGNRRVAEMFIGVDLMNDISSNNSRQFCQQLVLFEIDVDSLECPDVIVADINGQSDLPDENEVIFNPGSAFIVNQIMYDAKKSLWFIQMCSTSSVAQIYSQYETYINTRLKDTSPIILFGHALAKIENDYTQSLIYFHRLLRTFPVNHCDIPIVYYNLGRIYYILEKYPKALTYFRCAYLLLHRLLPQRMFDYCRVLRGLGKVYLALGDLKRALRLLEQAVILQYRNLPDNHTEIPFHLHRLGHAYFKAKQFEHALSVLDRSDNFFRAKMPVDHHGHANTLQSMGSVYRALGNDDKALECFQEALQKHESLLAKDHPFVASTCHEISLVYINRGERKLALEYAKRSLDIRLAKLPLNHSKLRQSKELVSQLQNE